MRVLTAQIFLLWFKNGLDLLVSQHFLVLEVILFLVKFSNYLCAFIVLTNFFFLLVGWWYRRCWKSGKQTYKGKEKWQPSCVYSSRGSIINFNRCLLSKPASYKNIEKFDWYDCWFLYIHQWTGYTFAISDAKCK